MQNIHGVRDHPKTPGAGASGSVVECTQLALEPAGRGILDMMDEINKTIST